MFDSTVRKATGHRLRGFTIIEILVVAAIIVVLIALAIPAIQQAREASRRSTCSDHLRGLAMAVHDYASEFSTLPPSAAIDTSEGNTEDSQSWGVHGRLLQFLNIGDAAKQVDLSAPWQNQAALDGLLVAEFRCPTDVFNDRMAVQEGSTVTLYPSNYAFCFGTGFVFDPATGASGDGLFLPNASITLPNVTDGQSNTLMISDVKTWQQYAIGGETAEPRLPRNTLEAEALLPNAKSIQENGHTLWTEGTVHQTGFTCTLQPNSFVGKASGEESTDTDYTTWPEGTGGSSAPATFAAITARSYHSGLVQVAMADGSVIPINELIDLQIWKSLATRAGGESHPEF